MPKSRIIFFIGFFLGLQPIFLHFPKVWEDFFLVIGGLGIVLLSALISVDKRITRKAKAEKRQEIMRARMAEEAQREFDNTNQDTGVQSQ